MNFSAPRPSGRHQIRSWFFSTAMFVFFPFQWNDRSVRSDFSVIFSPAKFFQRLQTETWSELFAGVFYFALCGLFFHFRPSPFLFVKLKDSILP